MFASPSQVLCTVYGLNIFYYGVIMAIAISVGTLVADWIGTKYFELKKETIIDMAPWVILFGVLGARLYYCALNFHFYLRFPTEILAVRHGGMSIHGALIGGIIGILIFSYRHKISAWKLCDVSVIGLALAQAIGRWGNFFNSEAFGAPTALPWKLYIAPQYRPIPYQEYSYFHPTFLYESIFDIFISLILFYILKKNVIKKNGNLMLIYLFLYSVVRIFVENIRIDSVRYVHGYPVAILMSLLIIILSIIIWVLRNNKDLGEI